MDRWYEHMIIETRRREEDRLAAETYSKLHASERPASRGRLVSHLLSQLGSLLMEWGCRLQSRYGEKTLGQPVSLPDAETSPCAS